jgi:glutathione S-transferase
MMPMTTQNTSPHLILCELGVPDEAHVESHSPFCLKVHRALRAAGLPYERRHGVHPGVHKQHNARGQVPVLIVDGTPIADSTEIVKAIATLRPEALATSGEAWLWEEYADTSLNGFLVAARWADDANWVRTKTAYFSSMPAPVRAIVPTLLRKNVIKALNARDVWRGGADACWQRFHETLAHLNERAPSDGFWCGAPLSVADVSIFGQLWSLTTALTPVQRDAVRAQPRLWSYLQRVDEKTRV